MATLPMAVVALLPSMALAVTTARVVPMTVARFFFAVSPNVGSLVPVPRGVGKDLRCCAQFLI
jgi:hypothetical protein